MFLNALDDYLNTENGIVASGMISNFRTFWEEIIIDLANKLSIKINLPILNEKTPVSNARAFLKTQLFLKDADHSLISRFVDVLHAEGGHAFTSNTEYFRLTRNIGIEILLLLLSKIENVKV